MHAEMALLVELSSRNMKFLIDPLAEETSLGTSFNVPARVLK